MSRSINNITNWPPYINTGNNMTALLRSRSGSAITLDAVKFTELGEPVDIGYYKECGVGFQFPRFRLHS